MKRINNEKSLENEVKNFDLKEAFVLWQKESKNKTFYLNGKDDEGNYLKGFINNEKDSKKPKIKVYFQNEKGDINEEACVLWETTSRTGNIYLSGYTTDKQKIIAFYSNNKNSNIPYITAYYKD